VIRRATDADAAALAGLSGQLGYPESPERIGGRLRRLLASERDLVIVAEAADGAVIGWLHGAEQELLESGARCEILGLVVSEAARGKGVGRALVAAAEGWAAGRRLDLITVRSNVVRAESHPFYERLGFQRTKTQHAYRKRLG
jgi:GNAT superfamily N-acetyltransferase